MRPGRFPYLVPITCGTVLLVMFLLLQGCGMISQHRGYYPVEDRAENHFAMDTYARSTLPLQDGQATLLVHVDQEHSRTLAMGPILPIIPVLKGWDGPATAWCDTLTVRIHVEAQQPVDIDWSRWEITLADGRPLPAWQTATAGWIFGMPDEAAIFRVVLPPEDQTLPSLVLNFPEILLGTQQIAVPPVHLEHRTVTRYFVGM